MSNDEINKIIHEQVMGHRVGSVCYGPISILSVIEQGPKASWNCQRCGASGRLPDFASYPVIEHWEASPDYCSSQSRALDAFREACRTWSREQKCLFDWHLLGVGHLTLRSEFTRAIIDAEKPLVDRINEHFQPETICRAIVETIHEWERRQARVKQGGEAWKMMEGEIR